jgi:hypothetical protein
MTRAGCARPCAALAACNAAAAPLRAMRLSRCAAAALRLRASTTAAAARMPPPQPPPPPPPRGAALPSRRKHQTLVPSSTTLVALQPALGTAEVLWARERAPEDRPEEPEARARTCFVSVLNVPRRCALTRLCAVPCTVSRGRAWTTCASRCRWRRPRVVRTTSSLKSTRRCVCHRTRALAPQLPEPALRLRQPNARRASGLAAAALADLARAAPPWLPRDEPLDAHVAGWHRYHDLYPIERRLLVAATASSVARLLTVQGIAARAATGASLATRVTAAGVWLLDTGRQGSPEWMQSREWLLTASTYGKVLGLWDEKGMREAWVRCRGARVQSARSRSCSALTRRARGGGAGAALGAPYLQGARSSRLAVAHTPPR